jgi:hypothetical protein
MLVAVVMPDTSTGVVVKEEGVLVPSPSLPWSFLPQHFIVPSVSKAHEWEVPRATLVAVVMPDTATGVELSVVVPSPSEPFPLLPQHFIVPSVSRAHEW